MYEADCNASDFCNLENLLNEVCLIKENCSNIDVNPNLNQKHYDDLHNIISMTYLESNYKEIRSYDCEINIRLTSDIKYTSFVPSYGQFEYLRMPFGLKNAPAVF